MAPSHLTRSARKAKAAETPPKKPAGGAPKKRKGAPKKRKGAGGKGRR